MDPKEHLNEWMRHYPDTGKHVTSFRAGRGSDLPEWPEWCFLPMAAWYAMVTSKASNAERGLDAIADVGKLAAIGTWRYTQGVYRVQPDMLAALTNSTIFGDLPSEVFHRLPEWCVYVETPGLNWFEHELLGFFAHLEWDANTGREELRLLLNLHGGDLVVVPLHIGNWTVAEALEKPLEEAKKQAGLLNLPLPADQLLAYARGAKDYTSKLISLLLYLCSDKPEIDDARKPGHSPGGRPQPVKTKRGLVLFAAEAVRTWQVGEQTGERLRVQRLAGGSEVRERGSKRVHVRRGHWYGYWTGPRTGDQSFIYRWISPLVAGS
ncbi:AcrVA2 family anti-CRISPR protein [Paenibacillus pasadenensis]|nr:hypothetical protein [Paenibacillus pasadenensis]